MVNHVRTLLLNVSGDGTPGLAYPGEEYVPPDFRSVMLSPDLETVRKILFGGAPDRAILNYRLREILTVIHGTEMAEYVTAPDKRITYLPWRSGLWNSLVAGITAYRFVGSGVLQLLNNPGVVEQDGRIYFQWRLDVIDGSTINITYYDGSRGVTTTQAVPYTLTSGMSQAITLPGSSITFQFSGSPGTGWTIGGMARPRRGLADVVADMDRSLGESRYDTLFGVTAAEPYKTFRNLWERHDHAFYRLGGLVLALAYRMDETRQRLP